MNHLFQTIRAVIFYLLLGIWITAIYIFWTPLQLFNQKLYKNGGLLWLDGVTWMIRHIIGVRFKLVGKVPPAPAIIAAQHQSAWETFILTHMLDMPAIVLKKELLDIPIFGLYLRKVGMIAIDRSAGREALKQVAAQAEKALADGRYVIIFPEGTRMPYGVKGKPHGGIAALYNIGTVPVVPVTLDSGRFWPRKSLVKTPGEITLTFHPALPKDLGRGELISALEKLYYND